MAANQSFSDTANQLKIESSQISVSFEPYTPTATTGTISWNIPKPAIGCTIETLQYAGMVFVVSDKPITSDNFPSNGVVYTADPTVNVDLHAGDRIGNALVVAALYESSKKSNGQTLTTSIVVTDLKPNTSYYICGFPVDNQFRYYMDGVRGYSDVLQKTADPSLPATQTVEFQTPIVASTGTNLVPGFTYTFDFILNNNYNYQVARSADPRQNSSAQIYSITLNGTDCGTYGNLVTEIQKQIKKLNNPRYSPVPPNTGMLYWNNQTHQLFEFNGSENVLIPNVFYQTSNPATVVNGTTWYNPDNRELNVYNSGWVNTSYTTSTSDPTTQVCSEYWFDGSSAFKWNGTTWCEINTIIQTTDPSCATINCGAFWFDETTSTLNSWDDATQHWLPISAITWDVAPNALVVNTKWFDLSTNILSNWNGSSWVQETALTISETQPLTPALASFWFKKSTEELKQWNGSSFVLVDCLVWNNDPTIVTTCNIWWNSTNDTINVWDTVHSQWVQAQHFTQSNFDPHLPPHIDDGVVWVNGEVINEWDSTQWIEIQPILSATDPLIPAVNSYWINDTIPEVNQWNGSSWVVVNAIVSSLDPSVIPTGTYWYNSSNNVLSVRNGLSWLAASYVTNSLIPTKGTLWYNSATDMLMEWNGVEWIESTPLISVEITSDGKLLFTSRDDGANMYLGIDAKTNNTLFPALSPRATIWTPTLGGDGKSNIPSYAEPGVGTDTTPDERRVIIDNIRRRLGAPTVEVELDQYTLSLCVDRAIEYLRQQSGIAYKRGFFFLDIQPHVQVYKMTNRQIGYHKIVTIMAAQRFTSAFMTSAHGSGAYGQVVLQQLYSMGTYDLTSYYLIAQYIEQMEMLFSTRISFNWDEASRNFTMFHSFYTNETILLDCMVERTEQEMMTDRTMKPWIEKYALSEAMFNLSQIRGKFSSLPGASGGISLNASDLASTAQRIRDECIADIELYVVNNPEDVGIETQFIIG